MQRLWRGAELTEPGHESVQLLLGRLRLGLCRPGSQLVPPSRVGLALTLLCHDPRLTACLGPGSYAGRWE